MAITRQKALSKVFGDPQKKLLKNNYNFDYVKLHLKFNQRTKNYNFRKEEK